MTSLIMETQIQPSATPFDRKSAPGQGKLRRGREDDCGVVFLNDVYKLPTTTTGARSRKQPESLAVQVGADDHHSNVQQHEYIYSQSVQLAYASTGNLKASTPEYPWSSNLVADQSVGDGPAQYSYESSHGDCYDDYHQQQQAAGYHEEYYYPHDQYNTPASHQMYRYDGGYYEQGGGAYGKAGGEGYPPTPGILPHDPRYDHDMYDDEVAAVRRDGEEFPATTYHDQDECPVHLRPYQGDGYYSYQDKQQRPRQQQDTRSTKAKADADAMAALFRDMEAMGLKPAAVAPRAA
ncbi:hypothetical protein AaE_004029 [Aphanomyces astaci]|uniref:Uncharacterized protein n=1 Tax=Aphanomyces astaci TaxID=112090 RepID=A0A6A5ABL8_APHAT|nr:hypothetical protein AaE_004029 [Aphanomyces astaci]